MSLAGIEPPQGETEIRALNRGGGFPSLQLIPSQGIVSGGGIPPGFIFMQYENLPLMTYEDGVIMDYEE